MRVLVVDDHSLFRDGIISLLEAAGFVVAGQAGNGREAVEQTLLLRPDLVLMDISMPEMSGLEALRRIKAQLPDTRVVMLTVSDSDANLFAAIKAGAQGYLLKSLDAEEFLNMLRGLEQGEAAITRQTAARVLHGYANISRPQSEPLDQLTQRETEILILVAEGLSNKAIAQKLILSENTVKYHLRNILQKLGAKNRTEAATHALRAGLLNQAPPS
jgi:DNA-binding NarL/FixJ family response regulator